MKNYQNKYRSQTNRWVFWDYSAPAAYYLTVVTKNKQMFFGEIIENEMRLSEIGLFLKQQLDHIPAMLGNIMLDTYVIMPDHFHCILIISDDVFAHPRENLIDGYGVDTIYELYLRGLRQSKLFTKNHHLHELSIDDRIKQYNKLRRKMTIPLVMGKLKMQVSKQINILNNTPGKTNWQHDYYDTIIRTTKDYMNIRKYIVENPKKWKR